MEIPDAIKKLTVDKHDFISVLLQDESKGIIIARVAFLDFLLGEVLSTYFCGTARRSDFSETIVSRLSFDGKISTLTELPLGDQLAKMRDQIIVAIRPMQKLRNVAGHAAGLKTPEIDKLYSDQAKRALFANFPKSFEQAASRIQECLQELKQASGFAVTF